MKLGTGNNKYRIIFIDEMTNRTSYKNVYADTIKEAEKLFADEYEKYITIRIKEIKEIK